MSDSKILKRFFALYAATYMTNAVYGTFMPVYLKNLGFNDIQMGSLLALAHFIAIAAQPVWGTAGDRAKTKNFILNILLSGGAATILLYPLSSLFGKLEYKFAYMFAIMSVFTFFQTSVNPLSDAITLEFIDTKGWKFGPIRMSGTLGFAVMSVIAGIVAKMNLEAIFALYFLISITAVIVTSGLPGVKGHQSRGNKVPMWLLFKNRELVLLMGINLVVQTTLGFYYSFFPKYYTSDLGADNVLGHVYLRSQRSPLPAVCRQGCKKTGRACYPDGLGGSCGHTLAASLPGDQQVRRTWDKRAPRPFFYSFCLFPCYIYKRQCAQGVEGIRAGIERPCGNGDSADTGKRGWRLFKPDLRDQAGVSVYVSP